jgi:hypothetical protein
VAVRGARRDEAELSYGGTSAQTERSKRFEATSSGGYYGLLSHRKDKSLADGRREEAGIWLAGNETPSSRRGDRAAPVP